MEKRVVVLGGGIGGLSVGYWARKGGARVTVLEQAPQAGGWMSSQPGPVGRPLERGPRTIRRMGGGATRALVRALQLEDRVVPASGHAFHRFILTADDVLRPVGGSFRGILQALGQFGVARAVLTDLVSGRPSGPQDESIHTFFERRFGRPLASQLASAMVRGIWAGDSQQLSVQACFPDLVAAEHRSRSLLVDALNVFRSKRRQMPEEEDEADLASVGKASFYSFRDGCGTLPAALAEALGPDLRTGIGVRRLGLKPNEPAVVELSDGTREEADWVVSALPAYELASVLSESGHPSWAHSLRQLPYASVATVQLVYDGQPQLLEDQGLRGFGFLTPPPRPLLGMIFESEMLAVEERATRLTAMLGGAAHPEMLLWSDEALIQEAVASASRVLGMPRQVSHAVVQRAQRAIPQPHVGYPAWRDALESACAEHRLVLAGSAFAGPGVNHVTAKSRKVASALLQSPFAGHTV